jgi:hypothetical protein
MRTASRLALASGACLSFAFAPAGERPAFGPEPGTTLRKTFTLLGDFELDDLSFIADGQDMADMLGLELTIKSSTKIGVTDVYDALDAGRPKKLTRTFDAVEEALQFEAHASVEMGGEGSNQDLSFSSELEGETVVFTWNEEKGGYDVALDHGEGDPELLDGLTEDMDLRVLLPDAEVSEGDTWEVEIAELEGLAIPGGDLKLVPEGAEFEEADFDFFAEIGKDFNDKMGELFEGKCICTFKGVHEKDGLRLGEIAIQIEVASTMDLSALITETIEKFGESEHEMPEFAFETADLNLDFQGEGALLWDLEAGCLHSFDLTGDAQIAFDIAASIEAEGQSHHLEASAEVSGTYEQGVETDE